MIRGHLQFPDLAYDSVAGEFFWVASRGGSKLGKKAGTLTQNGYLHITYNYKAYLAHRLAWFFVHGKWPDGMIDHINRNKLDNRIENLRVVDNQTNQRNAGMSAKNTSGHRGVYWHKNKKKWLASIRVDNKQLHLGSYNCITAAMFARKISEEFYGWKT